MTLIAAWADLDGQLDVVVSNLRAFMATKSSPIGTSSFSFTDECLLEGILSRAWQIWCGFCRQCVVESCIGTTNGAGVGIAPQPQAASEHHVSAAAIKAKKLSAIAPYWGSTNTILREEPTWGDVDILVRIVPRLAPTNASQLLAAFSSSHPSAKALQTIRNGAAHDNVQSRAEILSLQSKYVVFPIGHPTHALFWVEPTTSDFLVTHAIQEIRSAALAAIY